MSERACRICICVLGALSLSGAALDVFGHEHRAWIAAAACAGAALLLWLRLIVHRRLVAVVLRVLDRPAPFGYDVTPIRSEAELREMWDVNCELYGEGALCFETYVRWWNKYPRSVHALRLNGRIEGGITIWPLKRKPFKEYLSGRGGLDTAYFYSVREAAQCRHWLVSGIAIRPQARSPEAMRYLLLRALRTGMETGKRQFSGSICAVAYSPQGAKLLERFGFAKRKQATPHGFPLYTLTNVGAGLVWRMALRIRRYKRSNSKVFRAIEPAAQLPV